MESVFRPENRRDLDPRTAENLVAVKWGIRPIFRMNPPTQSVRTITRSNAVPNY